MLSQMQDTVGVAVWFHTCCTYCSDGQFPLPESSFAVLSVVFAAVASCCVIDMPAYHGFDLGYPQQWIFLPRKLLARTHGAEISAALHVAVICTSVNSLY